MWEGSILLSLPLLKNLILLARIELLATQPPLLDETFSASVWKDLLQSPSHRYVRAPFRPFSHSNSISGEQSVISDHILLFSQMSVQFPLLRNTHTHKKKKKEKKENSSFTCLNVKVWKEASDSLWRDFKALMQLTSAATEIHTGTWGFQPTSSAAESSGPSLLSMKALLLNVKIHPRAFTH